MRSSTSLKIARCGRACPEATEVFGRVDVKPSAWNALMEALPTAFTAFTRIPSLAAIDIPNIFEAPDSRIRGPVGMPQGWMLLAGEIAPFIPDVTGPTTLAADLWSVGNEIMAPLIGGDLDVALGNGGVRTSLLFTRDFAVARDAEELEGIAIGTRPAHDLKRLFHGFCGRSATAHGQLALQQRIQAGAALYVEILSREIAAELRPGEIEIGS